MSNTPIIVWFRRDLRIADNPALHEAAKTGRPVICLYVLETDTERELGSASRWWLHYSLKSLAADLDSIGAKLILRRGQAYRVVDMLIEETGADSLYWNRRYDLAPREIDGAIKADLSRPIGGRRKTVSICLPPSPRQARLRFMTAQLKATT